MLATARRHGAAAGGDVIDLTIKSKEEYDAFAASQGLTATCTRMVPYVSIMLFTNEWLKRVL